MDLRHCDRKGCLAQSKGHQTWLTVTRSEGQFKLKLHFCSIWCLAQWAVDDVTVLEYSERGPITRVGIPRTDIGDLSGLTDVQLGVRARQVLGLLEEHGGHRGTE